MNIKKISKAVLLLLTMTLVTVASACSTGSSQYGATSTATVPKPTATFADDPSRYPIVTIVMENGGKIEIELYPHIAPNTVLNFISLIKKGYYNGLKFHRVVKDFVIQGGDPQGTGMGDPGYSVYGEFLKNGFRNELSHKTGVVSMARKVQPDSAGSQFFIVTKDSEDLDGSYAAFGRVISGMDIVKEIEQTAVDKSEAPVTPQIMKTVTVDTKGVEYPEPVIIPLK